MFELFVTICLATAPDKCNDYWLAGGTSKTQKECEAKRNKLTPKRAAFNPHCQLRPKPSLSFIEIAPGVFAHEGKIDVDNSEHEGDISNIGFIIGQEAVLAFDSGGSMKTGSELYLAIRAQTELPITYLALSHMHPDHIFGASELARNGTTIIGHKNLERALLERRDTYLTNYAQNIGDYAMAWADIPTIDIAVEDSYEVNIGNRPITITAWETAHTNNDLTLFDTATKTLFTGDLLFDQHIPVIDGSLRGWQQVLKELEQIDYQLLVPGHGSINPTDGFTKEGEYLNLIAEDTLLAIKGNKRLSDAIYEIGDGARQDWQLFDEFNPRNASAAFSELEWE